jgi:hypothetical protein
MLNSKFPSHWKRLFLIKLQSSWAILNWKPRWIYGVLIYKAAHIAMQKDWLLDSEEGAKSELLICWFWHFGSNTSVSEAAIYEFVRKTSGWFESYLTGGSLKVIIGLEFSNSIWCTTRRHLKPYIVMIFGSIVELWLKKLIGWHTVKFWTECQQFNRFHGFKWSSCEPQNYCVFTIW